MDQRKIPLLILIVDTDQSTARAVAEEASRHPRVHKVTVTHDIAQANEELQAGTYNAILIDPLSVGLDRASDFIFTIRRVQPEIVFGLFVDSVEVDSRRADFLAGDRQRFSHYYTLDKRTPFAAFPDEVRALLALFFTDLMWRQSAETLKRISAAVKAAGNGDRAVGIGEELDKAISLITTVRPPTPARPRVFLSHKFAETEYVDGLTQLLTNEGSKL